MATEDDLLIEEIKRKRYDTLRWSEHENRFRKRPRKIGEPVSFGCALREKIKSSVFGSYVKFFNERQKQGLFLNENKLSITKWNLERFDKEDAEEFVGGNSMVEGLCELLVKGVKEEDVVDLEFLFKELETLRLIDCNIGWSDKDLYNFRNLQAIILISNRITNIRGSHLPRGLKFLELYDNAIRSLRPLSTGCPDTLLHLGIGRNGLDDVFQLHFLADCSCFKNLRTLDISDNDFYDIYGVLEPIRKLRYLSGFILEGNPCYTCCSYKDLVVKALPALRYLDYTEILEEDRNVDDDSEEVAHKGAITFTCHKIFALPSPPKDKTTLQKFHFELTLPLFEEIIIEPQPEPEPEPEPKPEEPIKDRKQKSKSTKTTKSHKSGKPTHEQTIYDAENEYTTTNKCRDVSFKTDRFAWSKDLQLPEENLLVFPYDGDLRKIRDTFRTSVNVKLVYLQVKKPVKPKGKKNLDVTNEEVILKRITLADFYCDLRPVNWSEKTVDFYWAKHPSTMNKAVYVDGNLRTLEYIRGKKDKQPKKDRKEDIADESKSVVTEKLVVPNIFTVQVGFGLHRNYSCS